MSKVNTIKHKLTIKSFIIFFLFSFSFSTLVLASGNSDIHSEITNLLGIKSNGFSETSISKDSNKKTIDITNFSKTNNYLEISKVSKDWIYNLHDFSFINFTNNNSPLDIILVNNTTTIQISGNTFKNTKSAFSFYYFPNYNISTSAQNYTPKNGSVFTFEHAIYKIIGNKKVSLLTTLSKSSTITIPSYVSYHGNNYKVDSLYSGSFRNNKTIKKIVIPETVTSIESKAFENCKKLKNITIHVNKRKSIKSNAFNGINKKAKFTIYCKSKKQFESTVQKIKKATNRKEITYKYKKKK